MSTPGRAPLVRLVQQIADTLAAGRDSESQDSDGAVGQRLRAVLTNLLDAMADCHPGKLGVIYFWDVPLS